jgi:Flp pilus assembly protein TadB
MAQAPKYRNFKDTEQAGGRLHIVPSIRHAAICIGACFVIMLALFEVSLAAGVVWFFIAAVGLLWNLGGYSAKRRCI